MEGLRPPAADEGGTERFGVRSTAKRVTALRHVLKGFRRDPAFGGKRARKHVRGNGGQCLSLRSSIAKPSHGYRLRAADTCPGMRWNRFTRSPVILIRQWGH